MGIPTLLHTTNVTSSTAQTAITSGIDSTYDEYMFVVTDLHQSGGGAGFWIQASTDSGSSYDTVATTTAFNAKHTEAGTGTLQYETGHDRAQSGTGVHLLWGIGNDNDMSAAGIIHLFNPSSTTYVKHFYATFSEMGYDDSANNFFAAGYFNTTSAIDAVQFDIESGTSTIDNVTIQMYGIS